MDNNFELVETRIIANAIIDWCKNNADKGLIHFKNSFVSSYKKFRFTTDISEQIIPSTKDKKGYWNNGVFTLYEIENVNKNITVSLLISSKDLINKDRLLSFLDSNMVSYCDDLIVVKKWTVFTSNNKLENLQGILDNFFFGDFKVYENEIKKWVKNNNYLICDNSYELIEGALKNIVTNKFERNKEARKKCIEYHGSKCKICGFDFGKVYGEEFEGKIEVHHKKPLYEIRKDYVVDPINDLIPVCSNCHLALHSKKDGVYTPEEVIEMLNKQKNNR